MDQRSNLDGSHPLFDRDGVVETAALELAAALRAEASSRDAPPPRQMASWHAANAARVELLLTLAEEAVETWSPDLALSLLRAAWRALGNVDDGPLPANPYTIGPIERALQERLTTVGARMLWLLKHEETYRDGALRSTPTAVLKVLHEVAVSRRLEAESNAAE